MIGNRSILIVPILAVLAACSPSGQTPTVVIPISTETPPPLAESTCQSISLEPTPDAKISSLFPPVSETDHVKGPQDASMTIIEYGDFQ